MKKKFNLQRSLARSLLMQALYSWVVTDNDINKVKENTLQDYDGDLQDVDIEYYQELFPAICKSLTELDAIIGEFTERGMGSIGKVELAVLRIGVYEILHRIDVPEKVAINEAVELSKEFGSADSYKFVNGVLDKTVKKYRKSL